MFPSRPLVVGVGNRHRHDDAVGLDAADRVRQQLGDRVRVVAFDGESTGLLDLWEGVGSVVLVDAVRTHLTPGRIHRFEGDLSPLLAEPATTSTHGLTVGEAWKLGRSLGQLPDRLVVFGVEGVDFSPGVGLSPAVARALGPLVGAIVTEVNAGPVSPPIADPAEAVDA